MNPSEIKDMELVEKIDYNIESFELAVQKSLSMVALNVDIVEAFSEPLKLLQEILAIAQDINDDIIKLVALQNISSAFNELQSKMTEQIA